MQLDWEKELSDIFNATMTCQACGATAGEMVVGFTRSPEAAEFAARCRDCTDKQDCDARKLVVVCDACAPIFRVNGALLDEEGMMSVFLEECRRSMEESLDFISTHWKEELDVPYERLQESLADVDPDLFREEDGWRLRLEEEYLQLHRWFRENNRRIPNPGWRSQYVEEAIALGCTTLLGD